MNTKPVYPIFKCLPRAIMDGYKDGMKFWCPYCQTWHLHGRGNGHRCAHCCDNTKLNRKREDSPLSNNGYILKMMSKQELREIKKEIEAYLNEGSEK